MWRMSKQGGREGCAPVCGRGVSTEFAPSRHSVVSQNRPPEFTPWFGLQLHLLRSRALFFHYIYLFQAVFSSHSLSFSLLPCAFLLLLPPHHSPISTRLILSVTAVIMSSRQPRNATTPVGGSTSRQNEYFVPRDGIDREVISADICRYLGNDALVRPGHYEVGFRLAVFVGVWVSAIWR
mgnify:CR=1 FL=1